MPIDPELIRRKMRLILTDLDDLRVLGEKDIQDYLSSRTDELVAERLLERMIGRMIDINYHLIVESGGMPPSDYHESFVRLADLGVLSHERLREIARCAGLRNRLAHEYDMIDPQVVHAAIRTALTDIPEYLRALESLVDS
jgi:uncharacterized protein YutE (UPF0331/DUF86 family)